MSLKTLGRQKEREREQRGNKTMRQTAELVSGHKSAVVLLLHSVFTYKVYFLFTFLIPAAVWGEGGGASTHISALSHKS